MSELAVSGERLLAEAREVTDRQLERLGDELAAVTPGRLGEALRYALGTTGKRVRPALVLASYRAAGGADLPGLYQLAAAVEVIHTYSLVHDDLPCMDDDARRRGRPTTHIAFDVPVATRVGYLLVPAAIEVLCRATAELGLAAESQAAIARVLLDASGPRGMVGGQWLDLAAEGRVLDARDLEEVHARKTAALIRGACLVGGLAAGATGPILEALGAYGSAIGLAFQVADDVLDATATTAQLGKTAGRDRSLGKSTYVTVYGVNRARAEAARLAELAVARLHQAPLDPTALASLARYIVQRQS
ncbi:MAG: polyprenyl synthetase family protein [Gemmatimonadales bacterium]